RIAEVPSGKESESLEHRAILDAFGVLDQFAAIAIRAFQVSIQTIRRMLNSAAQPWVVHHVHDGSVNVGNRHLGTATPTRFDPKYLRLRDVAKSEFCTMPRLPPFTHRLCGHY